jgi:hypothetical protein
MHPIRYRLAYAIRTQSDINSFFNPSKVTSAPRRKFQLLELGAPVLARAE